MKILITGSSGFIGKYLINSLQKNRHVVHSLSRTKSNLANHFKVSLSNKSRIFQILEKNRYDVVIHLAASLPNKDNHLHSRLFLNNCLETINLLQGCSKTKVRRVIFASTHLVYGKSVYLPIDEKHPLDPQNNYAISKLVGENLCKMFHDTYGIEVIILRISSVYGYGQQENYIIPTIITNILSKKTVEIHKYQNGYQIMDLINVKDVSKAFELACTTKKKFGIYNIASGNPITVQSVVKILSKNHGIYKNKIKKIRKNTNHFFYDTALAKKELKFNPKYTLDKGIHDILNKMIK